MDVEIYCDESRQELFGSSEPPSSGQYVLIGGLWIEAHQRETLKSRIHERRGARDVRGEFKWGRVSPSRVEFYKDLVDLFFDAQAMHFRCLALPADELDAVQFHDGDNELMFYKFYYQLLHPWILDFNTYKVFVDLKTNRVRQRLAKLRRVLQNSNRFAEIVGVQALPSHEVDLLQLADLLIGAVGYHFHGTASSAAKRAIVSKITERLGHPIGPTPRSVQKFNVFRWRPGGTW